jgi:hypothetical protein
MASPLRIFTVILIYAEPAQLFEMKYQNDHIFF